MIEVLRLAVFGRGQNLSCDASTCLVEVQLPKGKNFGLFCSPCPRDGLFNKYLFNDLMDVVYTINLRLPL